MSALEDYTEDFARFHQLEHEYIGYQSLTDVPRVSHYSDELKDYSVSLTSKNVRLQIDDIQF